MTRLQYIFAIMCAATTTACSEPTAPDPAGEVPGAWIARAHIGGPDDTLFLWIADLPDQTATALLRPSYGGTDFTGTLRLTGTQLTGTLGQWPSGAFDLVLEVSRDGLVGTLYDGGSTANAITVAFTRLRSPASDIVGSWVTSSVLGAGSGIEYLDTLVIRDDGRASNRSLWSFGQSSCSMSGLRGFFRRAGEWLVIRWAWPYPIAPCQQFQALDSLRINGQVLVRTRRPFGTPITETLSRP